MNRKLCVDGWPLVVVALNCMVRHAKSAYDQLLAENQNLREENAALKAKVEDLEKANVELADESRKAKQALNEGFEKFVHEDMECRGDEDCDHCYLVAEFDENRQIIKCLKDEVQYLNKQINRLKGGDELEAILRGEQNVKTR